MTLALLRPPSLRGQFRPPRPARHSIKKVKSMKYRHLAVAGAVALVCSFAALSRAAEDEQQEYARAKAGLAKAKLTLEQAVEAAVTKVPHGKAVEAATETEQQGTVFEVAVISGKKHMEVQVDAATGEILGVEE